MFERMTFVLLTQDEVKVVTEALEDWIKSATRDTMMAGLFVSALMSNGHDGEAPEGRELRNEMRVKGEEEAADRKRKAYAILAKL